jgi:hypothetical protein
LAGERWLCFGREGHGGDRDREVERRRGLLVLRVWDVNVVDAWREATDMLACVELGRAAGVEDC